MLRNQIGKALYLNINEIYRSIQGEGLLVGSPCVFIRIQGCNLRCPWCDQPSSLGFVERYVEVKEIVRKVEEYKCKHVVITGGEPFTEPNLHFLVKLLLQKDFFVQIETNGTLWNENLTEVGDRLYISCSPKREADFYVDQHILRFSKEMKFVVDENFEDDIILEDKFRRFLEEGKIILQPENNRKDMFFKALNIQNKLLNLDFVVRIIPQIHKVFNIP